MRCLNCFCKHHFDCNCMLDQSEWAIDAYGFCERYERVDEEHLYRDYKHYCGTRNKTIKLFKGY